MTPESSPSHIFLENHSKSDVLTKPQTNRTNRTPTIPTLIHGVNMSRALITYPEIVVGPVVTDFGETVARAGARAVGIYANCLGHDWGRVGNTGLGLEGDGCW
jgi:hypothetical protein